jgi:hypothetical protein
VAAINDMVAEMARMNSLLERNVQAAESSTAAIGHNMEEQRMFQAIFLTGGDHGFYKGYEDIGY